jgi:hypothetical protein
MLYLASAIMSGEGQGIETLNIEKTAEFLASLY